MSQLAIAACGPEPAPELAQWFTRPEDADRLVGLASAFWEDANRRWYRPRVLEPSAGAGNLVRAIIRACPTARIDAIELDARHIPTLATLAPGRATQGDFLTVDLPRARYDIAVANPPFDGGEEGPHLARIFDVCDRALLLLPARSLHGRARFNEVWSRFSDDEAQRKPGEARWYLRQEIRLIGRPAFGEKGGTDEILLLDARRAPGPCRVRWM